MTPSAHLPTLLVPFAEPAAKSIRTELRKQATQGAWRIRTAVRALSASYKYVLPGTTERRPLDGRGHVPSQEVPPMRFLAISVSMLTLLICCATKASAARTAASLRAEIHKHVREVEQAKTTIRFFRTHSILLYKWKTKAAAHRDRAFALERVRWGRVQLRRLRAELVPIVQPIPHLQAWLCIHAGEGAWNANTGNGYYGGLQMDVEFQGSYAPWLLRSKGTADHWTPREQMLTAERAYKTRGFYPWPNTARACGLI